MKRVILIKKKDLAPKRYTFNSFPELLEKTDLDIPTFKEHSRIDKRSLRRWADGAPIPKDLAPLFTTAIYNYQKEKWYPVIELSFLGSSIDGNKFNPKTNRAGTIGKKRTHKVYMDDLEAFSAL